MRLLVPRGTVGVDVEFTRDHAATPRIFLREQRGRAGLIDHN
jgi:hypothetical protein